jgi:hypothetical protein
MGVERVQDGGWDVSWPLATWTAAASPLVGITAIVSLARQGLTWEPCLLVGVLGLILWRGARQARGIALGLAVGVLVTALAFALHWGWA